MAGDTILFRRGSTFEFQGQFRDGSGAAVPLTGITPDIYQTEGSGMQDVSVNVVNAATGTFLAYLPKAEAEKLPPGRNSWFKIRFTYDGSSSVVVFPPIWLDVR